MIKLVNGIEVPLTEAEAAEFAAADASEAMWDIVRVKRNGLLAACDWTDTASAPARLGEELYGAWQAYRQALRDVTTQGDPVNITWPVAP